MIYILYRIIPFIGVTEYSYQWPKDTCLGAYVYQGEEEGGMVSYQTSEEFMAHPKFIKYVGKYHTLHFVTT